MRLHEFITQPQNETTLTELFDPKSRFEVQYERDGNTLYATAYDRQGRTIDITMGPGGIPNTVDIEFMRGGSFEITGGGDAERVLSTVIGAIEYYFSAVGKPKYIAFHSREGSRSKLYQALINRLGRKLGYVQQDPRNPPPDIADYMFSTEGIFLLKNRTSVSEDISRRGFLQGLGATAGLGAVGYGAVQQKNRAWDAAKGTASDENREDMTATQPAKDSDTNAAASGVPQYSPQQLEKYIITYARQQLPVDQLIQFLAQAKTETHDFRSLAEYDSPKHSKYAGGKKYKGRGFLHITHDHNYEKYGQMIGQDLVDNPDLLLQPDIAAQASLAYWNDYAWPTSQRIMNKYKDRFKSAVTAVTRVVNGGYNKLAERQKNVEYYTKMFKPSSGKVVTKKSK